MEKLFLEQYKNLILLLDVILEPQYELALYKWHPQYKQMRLIDIPNRTKPECASSILDQQLQKSVADNYKHVPFIRNEEADGESTSNVSLFFIKNESNDLLGVLYIRSGTCKYQKLSQQIIDLVQVNTPNMISEPPSEPVQSLKKMVSDIISQTIGHPLNEKMGLNQQAKLEIVKELEEQSIFQIKGSVTEVANQLDCSEASVYRYINKVNQVDK